MRHAILDHSSNSTLDCPNHRLLSVAAKLVKQAGRAVVVVGAGISTNAGIDDFRGSGRYDRVLKHTLSSQTLRESPDLLLEAISQFRVAAQTVQPTATHQFLRQLRDGNRLVRVYSQNIDGLEAKVGLITADARDVSSTTSRKRKSRGSASNISPAVQRPECILLHGCTSRLRCRFCGETAPWPAASAGSQITTACEQCEQDHKMRSALGKRRCPRARSQPMRPDIILYDEAHPGDTAIASIIETDVRRKPDLVLVFGTSLAVPGIRQLLRRFAYAPATSRGKKADDCVAPRDKFRVLYINNTRPPAGCEADIDLWIQGDCDDWVLRLDEYDEDTSQLSDQELWTLVTNDGATYTDEYLVEALLDEKMVQESGEERRLFFVSWAGYSASSNSWEPETNIAADLVSQWDSRKAEINASPL